VFFALLISYHKVITSEILISVQHFSVQTFFSLTLHQAPVWILGRNINLLIYDLVITFVTAISKPFDHTLGSLSKDAPIRNPSLAATLQRCEIVSNIWKKKYRISCSIKLSYDAHFNRHPHQRWNLIKLKSNCWIRSLISAQEATHALWPHPLFEPWRFRFECQINIIIHYQIHFSLSIFGVLRLTQTDAEITAGIIFFSFEGGETCTGFIFNWTFPGRGG